MATILAHIRIHPGREPEFEKVATELHRESHAIETGLRRYEYWRGQETGLFYCLLAFDDFDAFLDHQTSPHHEGAAPQLGELIRDISLEWVDPVPGAADLPPTRAGSVPEDAEELRKTYGKLYAAKLADWWGRG